MRRSILALVLLLAACSKGNNSTDTDAGPPDAGVVDAGQPDVIEVDAGQPVDAGPALAPGFGPFTGTYDVNGAGLLMAVQVDNHLALQFNGQPNLYIGRADGGTLDGGFAPPDAGSPDGGRVRVIIPIEHFAGELVYPDLETCGPVTVEGVYRVDSSSYSANNDFCSGSQGVSGPLDGERLVAPAYYRQDLALSGVYDLKESPGANNTCTSSSAGPYKLTLGVSLGQDGGPSLILAAGDTILDEGYFGSVTGGVLIATAQDPLGRPTSSLSLHAVADGGYVGSRTFQITENGSLCRADFNIHGSRR